MSSVATKPDFTKDGFYNDFSKKLGYFNAKIMGSVGALCFVRTSPAGGASSKEMSSTRLCWRCRRHPLLRQQQERMVPTPQTSLPRLWQMRAGGWSRRSCALRLRAPCRASRLGILSRAAAAVKNKASMSLSKSLCSISAFNSPRITLSSNAEIGIMIFLAIPGPEISAEVCLLTPTYTDLHRVIP